MIPRDHPKTRNKCTKTKSLIKLKASEGRIKAQKRIILIKDLTKKIGINYPQEFLDKGKKHI